VTVSDTTPVVRLIAHTENARQALGMVAELVIDRFPCNVGRESRTEAAVISVDRRLGSESPLNDLFLIESTEHYYVSRKHFRIDLVNGAFILTDRGSMYGTTVNGTTIGGQRRGGRTELYDRDEIVVGDAASPFTFEFRVEVGGEGPG
jgi:pSer/pThr/pTyr-binding forkhead associated (FHA) protein